MWGRPKPARWTKSRSEQVRQPSLGVLAMISDRSLDHRSKETKVLRTRSRSPTRNFKASVASIEATRFTAEFKIPAVSQVSTVPAGGSAKRQVRQAVSPGITLSVAQ